ncbi:Coiled-coil-helix-coiled-coil-helix domain-containing protein 7 [Pseudolycoriella hygida]|uniref:Coiled-coil-helix-coiled-coil-helix domain-containing protein 7 n=1 Tax=Pseudolycoriella hygida TaxID=35572 RepID=A0A9Q0RZY5_9DIPT|nr:Coiled-coil-helix-coiled-coil-helix domain-containing protein 7 [Pseudolycoriella hygida]
MSVLQEQKMTYQCLSKNDYDREKCEAFFDNYNNCKEFWGNLYRERRRQRIRPYMPEGEEREKIRKEYIERMKNRPDA